MEISILHANSNVLMQRGLNALLEKQAANFRLDEAGSKEALFNKLSEGNYDIVVIDPDNTIEFDRELAIKLKNDFPAQKILMISDIAQEGRVLEILESGVQGYLSKQCSEEEIAHALMSIAKGDKFFCNKVLDIILNKDKFEEDKNCDPTILSERESEVTVLVARGLTNKEIANELHLSPHTIHTHRKNILKKLGVSSASEITRYALRVGLIEA